MATLDILTTDQGDEMAELEAALRVLSDPRRFQIMRSLTQAELCVCEVINELGLPQPLVSHHLGVLRRSGLVRSRRHAQWVYYSLNPEKLHVLARAFRSLFDPANLKPEALYGASSAWGAVDRDPSAAPCCARHDHRTLGRQAGQPNTRRNGSAGVRNGRRLRTRKIEPNTR